ARELAVDEAAAATEALRQDADRTVAERSDVADLRERDRATVTDVVVAELHLGIGEVAEHHTAAAADRLQDHAVAADTERADGAVVGQADIAAGAFRALSAAKLDERERVARQDDRAAACTDRLQQQGGRIIAGRE